MMEVVEAIKIEDQDDIELIREYVRFVRDAVDLFSDEKTAAAG